MVYVVKTSACNVESRAETHFVGRNAPSPGAAMHDCSYAFASEINIARSLVPDYGGTTSSL
jgi:hypothetical protein